MSSTRFISYKTMMIIIWSRKIHKFLSTVCWQKKFKLNFFKKKLHSFAIWHDLCDLHNFWDKKKFQKNNDVSDNNNINNNIQKKKKQSAGNEENQNKFGHFFRQHRPVFPSPPRQQKFPQWTNVVAVSMNEFIYGIDYSGSMYTYNSCTKTHFCVIKKILCKWTRR